MKLLDPDLVNWSVDGFGTHFTCKNRGLSLIGKMFLWMRSMVNLLCYVRQLRLFLMFNFFCLDFAPFYRGLAKFYNEENFQAISNVQYAYAPQPRNCHLRFSTNESCPVRVSSYVLHNGRRHFVKVLYLIDTRLKIS